MSVPEIIVIAPFRRADLLRLHMLLMTYESPFSTEGEAAKRSQDECAHRALGHEIARLLAMSADVPALGASGGKL